MIIRQTTTIVFEYPQDYLQEQEWCKTKEERWIHKSTDTLGAVYENTISYSIGATSDRKTEPQTCEDCKHWNDTEDDCADRHGCRATTEDCPTVPTSSKMEQVERDCTGCKFIGTYDTEFPCVNCSRKTKDYYAKDEPQTDCPWK